MGLREIVERMREAPRPVEGFRDRWYWSETSPKHTFHRVLALTPSGDHALQLSTRDAFDPRVAHAALDYSLERLDALRAVETLAALDGFPDPTQRFQKLGVAAPAIHIVHKAWYPELHARLFAVFPAYRCEIAGRLRKQEAEYLYTRQIPTLDLERAPCPLIRMRFSNAATRVRSSGAVRKIAPLIEVLREIERLAGDGSFVEIESFEGEVRTITCESGALLLWRDDSRTAVPQADLVEWTKRFTIAGAAAAGEPRAP